MEIVQVDIFKYADLSRTEIAASCCIYTGYMGGIYVPVLKCLPKDIFVHMGITFLPALIYLLSKQLG